MLSATIGSALFSVVASAMSFGFVMGSRAAHAASQNERRLSRMRRRKVPFIEGFLGGLVHMVADGTRGRGLGAYRSRSSWPTCTLGLSTSSTPLGH